MKKDMIDFENLDKTRLKSIKEEVSLIQKVISWRKYKATNKNNDTDTNQQDKNIADFIEKKFKNPAIQNLWLDEVTTKDYNKFVNFCSQK